MRLWAITAAVALGVLYAGSAAVAQGSNRPCADLIVSAPAVLAAGRALQADDLVSLVDIGDPNPTFGSGGFALSPDGRYLAFPIRRANAKTNSYCLGIVRIDLKGREAPLLLDTSEELVRGEFDFLGTLKARDYPAVVRPKWSHDGRWIAFEKSVDNKIQLWRVRSDGRDATIIPHTDEPLQDFAWLETGNLLTISRTGVAAAERAISEEEASGFFYDDRFMPNERDRPYPFTPNTLTYQVIDPQTGAVRAATDRERAGIAGFKIKGALQVVQSENHSIAWTAPPFSDRYGVDNDLHVSFPGGNPLRCGPERCNRVERMWWTRRGDRLIFVHREGWANSRSVVSSWHRGDSAPTRVLSTEDLLVDCQLAHDTLICGHESALRPRSIVAISILTGALRSLFEPNPAFSRLALGRVERLHWTNANGYQVFGDLVYPVGYEPGTRYPTIVTTYTSRGFLRGATGDEYPIQLFANRGYAVLSFQRPKDVGMDEAGVPDAEAYRVRAYTGWADRRSVQSAVEGGLRLLDEKGVSDMRKLAITGLSDGSVTVQFALLNSNLFSAAIVSQCCFEPAALFADSGLITARHFRAAGVPGLEAQPSDAWSAMSLVTNAERMRTPLLMELGSDEFRLGLSGYTTLRSFNRPVEMYVFPDEGHAKLQPAHRLAIYERNLAWLDFWLRDRQDTDLVSKETLARWLALKAASSLSGLNGAAPK